jgi:xylan 1,4-beta-xylosidase
LSGPAEHIRLSLNGIPAGIARVSLRHYRIDDVHSNAWTAWKKMGSPQTASPEQYAAWEESGQLELLDSPRWMEAEHGRSTPEFELPRQGVSLIQLTW